MSEAVATNKPRVLIFIVAYNAEKTIQDVLRRVPAALRSYDTEVLIIDDASQDQTFERGEELRVVIPDKLRVSHEEHFAQVTRQFFEYLKDPKALPAWEKPNMLAKYYVSTKGVEMALSKA